MCGDRDARCVLSPLNRISNKIEGRIQSCLIACVQRDNRFAGRHGRTHFCNGAAADREVHRIGRFGPAGTKSDARASDEFGIHPTDDTISLRAHCVDYGRTVDLENPLRVGGASALRLHEFAPFSPCGAVTQPSGKLRLRVVCNGELESNTRADWRVTKPAPTNACLRASAKYPFKPVCGVRTVRLHSSAPLL